MGLSVNQCCHAQLPGNGTVAQAAKMPMVAVTPTEVLEAMHHCMPNEEYPYSTSRASPKYPRTCSGVNPSHTSACSVRIHS